MFDISARLRIWAAFVIAASLFFLVMTDSKTAMGMLVIAGASGAVMRLYNPRNRSLVLPVALIAAIGVGSIGLMYIGTIQNVLDDPTAFTGRSQIWPVLLEFAGEHLWTGAGYESFWQIGEASPVYYLTNGWVAATVGQGHNGYLDVLATIGIPGLLLTIAVLFVWPALKLLYSTGISRSRRALFASIMIFALGHNMTESTLLDRASVVHVFLMIAIILIHRISSQSEGAHQRIRNRLIHLADRKRLGQMRARYVMRSRDPRPLPAIARTQVEDGIA